MPSSTSTATSLLVVKSNDDQLSQVTHWLGSEWDIKNLNHPDIQIINPELTTIGIDQVRKLIELLAFTPYQADFCCYIILAADLATPQAQNALLKSIEEPPHWVRIVLVTSQPTNLLETIRSRCVEVSLKSQPASDEHLEEETDIPGLWESLHQIDFGIADRLKAAEDFTQRDSALAVVTGLIQHGALQPPQVDQVRSLQILQKTLQCLRRNTNVKLTMDVCFLSLSTEINLSFPEINMV